MADWKLRRGDSEWPIESFAMLEDWVRAGRVGGSDYVFNPILEKWMYADDVRELRPLITNAVNSQNASSAPLAMAGGADTSTASSEKKQVWRHKLAIGITMIIVGIALITISPRLVSQQEYSYSSSKLFPNGGPTGGMTVSRTDNTGKDSAFFGGIALMIAGGILSAVGVSESKTSR